MDVDPASDPGCSGEGTTVVTCTTPGFDSSAFPWAIWTTRRLTRARWGSSWAGPRATALLTGGSGDDNLSGGPGNDALSGADGDDSLTGAQGLDGIQGGNGIDRLTEFSVNVPPNTESLIVDLAAGRFVRTGAGGETEAIAGIEDIDTEEGPDVITGGPGSNFVSTGGGYYVVNPGPGSDSLILGPGRTAPTSRTAQVTASTAARRSMR